MTRLSDCAYHVMNSYTLPLAGAVIVLIFDRSLGIQVGSYESMDSYETKLALLITSVFFKAIVKMGDPEESKKKLWARFIGGFYLQPIVVGGLGAILFPKRFETIHFAVYSLASCSFQLMYKLIPSYLNYRLWHHFHPQN